jgi:hypothetical protein
MLKKWIATILSISLVIGMAALLHACGKPKDAEETTAEPETSSAIELLPEADEGTTGENVWADLWDLEDMSYTEPTTDEHYQEEYKALTLPMAVTTQPVAGTTRAQTTTNPSVRETTTQFMFTTPSRAATTAKQAESTGTTAASESTTAATKASTTAAQQTTAEETTVLTDYVPNASGIQNVTPGTRPQVTYLDKYVTDIFKSGNFTLEMEQKEEGKTMPITLYENDDNLAVEVTLTNLMMQDLELPAALSGIGKVRFIVTGKRSAQPKAYIAWTGGYMEMENVDEITDMIREMQSEQDMNVLSQMMQADLEYVGSSSSVGYICESYKNTEQNVQINFYFAKTENYEGVVRWDQVDLTTGTTLTQTVMRLTRGVTNAKAFRTEGKKMSMEEFENMFNNG